MMRIIIDDRISQDFQDDFVNNLIIDIPIFEIQNVQRITLPQRIQQNEFSEWMGEMQSKGHSKPPSHILGNDISKEEKYTYVSALYDCIIKYFDISLTDRIMIITLERFFTTAHWDTIENNENWDQEFEKAKTQIKKEIKDLTDEKYNELTVTKLKKDNIYKTINMPKIKKITYLGYNMENGGAILINANKKIYMSELTNEQLLENTLKIARHEMGHVIIEKHCKNNSCLMNELIGDGDVELINDFCNNCKTQIDDRLN